MITDIAFESCIHGIGLCEEQPGNREDGEPGKKHVIFHKSTLTKGSLRNYENLMSIR